MRSFVVLDFGALFCLCVLFGSTANHGCQCVLNVLDPAGIIYRSFGGWCAYDRLGDGRRRWSFVELDSEARILCACVCGLIEISGSIFCVEKCGFSYWL